MTKRGNMQPIMPAQPLARWAIDHTGCESTNILNAVEYATGLLVASITATKDYPGTLPLLHERQCRVLWQR